MADDDILLKRSETFVGSSTDKMLNAYKEFEEYIGMRLGNPTNQEVWYGIYKLRTSWPTNDGALWYNTSYYEDDYGVKIRNYDLGINEAKTPLRYKLIPYRDYIENEHLYYISIRTEGSAGCPQTKDGTSIKYKCQIFFGWEHGYDLSGNEYNNPFAEFDEDNLGVNDILLALKDWSGTNQPFGINKASSCAFAEAYFRVSDTNIYGINYHGGSTIASHSFWGFTRYNAQNGKAIVYKNSLGVGDGGFTTSNSFGSSNANIWESDFWIPEDPYFYHTYYVYGICATSARLTYGYIDLSTPSNIPVKFELIYVGEDYDDGSGTSQSGFLQFRGSVGGDSSPDRRDGLRYIYIFRQELSRGFLIGYSDYDYLLIRGLRNVL